MIGPRIGPVIGPRFGPAPGPQSDQLRADQAQAEDDVLNASTTWEVYDDFVATGVAFESPSWTRYLNGGATAASAGENGHPGVLTLSTSTSATGAVAVASHDTAVLFGAAHGTTFFECVLRVPTLSTVGEEFDVIVGFADNQTGDAVDGVYFHYNRDGIGTTWQAKTAANSVRTTTDTTIAVPANTWQRLRIEVDGASTARFYIDGTLRATISTNIPNGAGRQTGIWTLIVKSAGTTARTIDIDYVHARGTFATPR